MGLLMKMPNRSMNSNMESKNKGKLWSIRANKKQKMMKIWANNYKMLMMNSIKIKLKFNKVKNCKINKRWKVKKKWINLEKKENSSYKDKMN